MKRTLVVKTVKAWRDDDVHYEYLVRLMKKESMWSPPIYSVANFPICSYVRGHRTMGIVLARKRQKYCIRIIYNITIILELFSLRRRLPNSIDTDQKA